MMTGLHLDNPTMPKGHCHAHGASYDFVCKDDVVCIPTTLSFSFLCRCFVAYHQATNCSLIWYMGAVTKKERACLATTSKPDDNARILMQKCALFRSNFKGRDKATKKTSCFWAQGVRPQPTSF